MNNLDKNKILSRVLEIVRKTGDKLIVTDELGESCVVMPLSEYEKIIESKGDYSQMSEKELLDSVERDIALWRSEHEDSFREDEIKISEPGELEDQTGLVGEDNLFAEDDKNDKLAGEFESFDLGWPEEDIEKGEDKIQPIKYEDIPPPPELNATDIMTEKEEPPVIDMSLDEDENDKTSFEEEDEEEGFMEEPVF